MATATLRSQILKDANDLYRFRLNGASLNRLMKFCTEQSTHSDEQIHHSQAVLQLVAAALKGTRKDLRLEDVEGAISEYQRRQGESVLQFAQVQPLTLEEYPLIAYDPLNLQYVDLSAADKQAVAAPSTTSNPALSNGTSGRHGLTLPSKTGPLRRVFALKQRYYFLLAQSLRSRLYADGLAPSTIQHGQIPLLQLKSLEGAPADRYVAVLGMLGVKGASAPPSGPGGSSSSSNAVVVPDGSKLSGDQALASLGVQWTLEDDARQVDLVATNAVATSSGIFCAGSIVIARGFWSAGKLVVKEFALPPTEPRSKTLAAVPYLDGFGKLPQDFDRALRMEQRTTSAVVTVLSQVHLDRPEVLQRLTRFFQTLATTPSPADLTVVFVGDFLSAPLAVAHPSHNDETMSPYAQVRGYFTELGNLIFTAAPSLAQNSKFVLVPGLNDITPCGRTLPSFPLCQGLMSGLIRRCPKTVCSPNPCRLRFSTLELVVARIDSNRLWKKPHIVRCVQNTTEGVQYQRFDHLVRTVLDQGSIAPCLGVGGEEEGTEPLWAKDHALRLFPMPHLVVLCESCEQWECPTAETNFVNPGSFSLEGTFLWLTPSDREMIVNKI